MNNIVNTLEFASEAIHHYNAAIFDSMHRLNEPTVAGTDVKRLILQLELAARNAADAIHDLTG